MVCESHSRIFAPILLTILAACGGGGNGAPSRAVVDSARVEIVMLRPGEDTTALEAPLAATPRTEIGVVDGPEELELSGVTGAVRLSDGRIVVANAGTNELRFYESVGTFSHAVGQDGEGPGEFRDIDFLGRIPGDTIIAYDGRLARISRFDEHGEFVESQPLSGGLLPYVVGIVDDSTLAGWQFTGQDDNRPGIYTLPVDFGVVDLPGAEFRVFGTVASSEASRVGYQGDVERAWRPFGRESDIVGGDDHIYVLTSSDHRNIRVYDRVGNLIRLLRFGTRGEPADASAVETWIESWMAKFSNGAPDIEAWWRRGFRETPPPDRIPLFRALEVDDEGNVCAERYPVDWTASGAYWCFSPKGELIRAFRLPRGVVRRGSHPYFDPQLEIRADEVIGVWHDELDVEYVRVYRFQ